MIFEESDQRCERMSRHVASAFQSHGGRYPPKNVIVSAETSLDVSSLSMDAGVAATSATTSIPITDIVIHPPKHIKQRMTVCALEKKCIEDMKQTKHKSHALKEAVCLYVQEKAKSDKLSLRQVQEKIRKKYSVPIHFFGQLPLC